MNRLAKLAVAAALVTPGLTIAAHAVNFAAITPHMEVKGDDGKHVGTVDRLDGDQLVLTKDDPAAKGVHHQLPLAIVDSVSKDGVVLNMSAHRGMALWTEVGKPAADAD